MKNKLDKKIVKIIEECSEPNWDGYGAVPVDISVCEIADKILKNLPPELDDVELLPEPDGDISFDWMSEKIYISISVGKEKMYYSFLNEEKGQKGHGEYSTEEKFPEEFIEKVTEIWRIK